MPFLKEVWLNNSEDAEAPQGLILSENYLAYRYSSSYSSNNSNSIVGVFGQYVSKQQTLNNPTKIKFYSHTGSTVMNEGLFWTETIMNPGKTT